MTKYCLFDGGDVVGPFTVKQLLLRTGFGDNSLVCPEEHTAEDKYWKEARHYPEFGFQTNSSNDVLAPVLVVPPVSQTDQFSDELDNVVEELDSFDMLSEHKLTGSEQTQDSLSVAASEPAPAAKLEQVEIPAPIDLPEPASSAPEEEVEQELADLAPADPVAEDALEQAAQEVKDISIPAPEPVVLPAEPAKPVEPANSSTLEIVSKQEVITSSPIEEYFNTMRAEDLGNILGMPDAKLNSDLNLARTLEKQIAQNAEQMAQEPAQESSDHKPEEAPDMKEETPDATLHSTQTEDITEQSTDQAALSVEENTPLSVAAQIETASATQEEKEPQAEDTPSSEPVLSEEDQAAQTVRNILAGTLRIQTQQEEVTEPIKQVPVAQEEKVEQITATQRPLEQRVISRKEHAQEKPVLPMKQWMLVGMGIVLVLGGACIWKLSSSQDAQEELLPDEQTAASEEVLPASKPVQVPSAQAVVPPASAATSTPAVAKTAQEIAKEVVQEYPLEGGRGTISHYLAQHYSSKLAEGYTEHWSAELLHKNTYVVKYRLAKTRQEPIVYIFQVDTAKKKLTGALNNITLDLVGKIK